MTEFLFLGNLMRQKGVLVLLDACSILRKNNQSFKCHFVGANSEDLPRTEIDGKIHELQLHDCVVMHGPMYGADKETMLQQIHIMVFPSFYHNECFPLVLLEAMKNKMAIISTNEGAIPDMVLQNNNGLLVEKENAQALANAMQVFIDSPHLAAEMGHAGFEHYQSNFTADIFINTLRSILADA